MTDRAETTTCCGTDDDRDRRRHAMKRLEDRRNPNEPRPRLSLLPSPGQVDAEIEPLRRLG